jgi:two-component system, chemotaxis family, protein-glutamate methylesterase/glutaminase
MMSEEKIGMVRTMETKIKVLIVDDAAMVRKIFAQELAKDPALQVVGEAADAFIARDKIAELKPDVLLLDIEMPQMDGLTFLEQVMINCPMPVIIVSSIAKEGGPIALRALELGAADVIAKPGPSYSVKEMSEQLIEKIKGVIQAKKGKRFLDVSANPIQQLPIQIWDTQSPKIIAIGAATGGPEAITSILTRLPDGMPPILIVQHMPPYFSKAFAERLNNICALEVKEAEHQELLTAGKVLLAPGNKHMVLQRNKDGFIVVVKDGPLVFHQRPSIEVLFRSVAMYAGKDAIGVILTGMGKDGAQGLLDMKNAGALTIAQDEESSVVFGLAQEAIAVDAVVKVAPLKEIPEILVNSL